MRDVHVCVLTTLALVSAAAGPALASEPPAGLPDPFHLLERKDFVAGRSSSNSPDPRSNDDSARPIPVRRPCSPTSLDPASSTTSG